MRKFYLLPLIILAAIFSGNVALAYNGGSNSPSFSDAPREPEKKNPKDTDVAAMLAEMGIPTEVDETELAKKYPSVNIKMGEQQLIFNVPQNKEKPFTLLIFDNEGNHLISYMNIIDGRVKVEREVLRNNEQFTYRLSGGNGETYAGKFALADLFTASK